MYFRLHQYKGYHYNKPLHSELQKENEASFHGGSHDSFEIVLPCEHLEIYSLLKRGLNSVPVQVGTPDNINRCRYIQ